MKFKKQQIIAETQRVFVYKNKQFKCVLTPGKHTFWDFKNELEFVTHNIDTLFFVAPNAERLYHSNSEVQAHINHYKLNEQEIGLLYFNDALKGVVAPGEHLYLWQDAGDIHLERVDISDDVYVDEKTLKLIEKAGLNLASKLIRTEKTTACKPIFQIQVERDHIGLLFIDNKLVKELPAGKYGVWQFGREIELKMFDCKNVSADEAKDIYQQNSAMQSVTHQKLGAEEVGLLYVNEILRGIIPPGEHVYLWKEAGDIHLQRVDISEDFYVEKTTFTQVNNAGLNSAAKLFKPMSAVCQPITDVAIDSEHIGLLYVNNQLQQELAPGRYGIWQFNRDIEAKVFDLRTQMLEVSGQEILSKDRVSLRINLSASFRVTDAARAASSVEDVSSFAYNALQLALREAIGTQNLDDLLLDKLYVNETVKALVSEPLAEIGVQLINVGMKDIILPGEMRAILNQVVEAQKAAEANVIKRREETAATRSLHNTAKVMENNPTLMRLKELEALEKVADKIDSLTVYGGLEGLMNNVVNLGQKQGGQHV
ncbi:slipin family protein [Pseudoalteromonas sp. SMS1]|uniref:slipin family protein n=1 Tax=Pseudoalteromonas sp. SMS1 TaxID=2908894 RepID=UPI001F3DB7F5|nr:slipin family protein [Pseudoalteromonas sp. SMS1]MCF2857784.1 slipin family protein [Pseudoalteromonas sp. SMS1]